VAIVGRRSSNPGTLRSDVKFADLDGDGLHAVHHVDRHRPDRLHRVQAGPDLTGVDPIFISATVGSGKVGDAFLDTPIPLSTTEHLLLDDLDMGGSPIDHERHRSLTVVDDTHPLAGGLSGVVYYSTTAAESATARLAHMPTSWPRCRAVRSCSCTNEVICC
jgi:hypothetical protein